MKICCLITGAPRAFERCAPSLQYYLSNHDVDFFLIYREDNCTPSMAEALLATYRPRAVYVTKAADTAELEANHQVMSMVIRMWHEVRMGLDRIAPHKDEYDLFFRIRYDNYFAPSFIEVNDIGDSCVIPAVYQYLGLNDMYCLAKWPAFFDYATTYDRLAQVLDNKTTTPELIASASLRDTQISVRPIEVGICRPWHDSVSDAELSEIVRSFPRALLTKYAEAAHSLEAVKKKLEPVIDSVRQDALFPIGSGEGFHWHAAEIDPRDGTVFRFFYNQAALWRPITQYITQFRIVVVHQVVDWPIEKLSIYFDGYPAVYETSVDEYGRVVIHGEVPPAARGRAPKSKIAFLFDRAVVPSLGNPHSTDDRLLSLALSDIQLIPARAASHTKTR